MSFKYSVFEYKLIYIYTIKNSPLHEGKIKIGSTSLRSNKSKYDLVDNCKELNEAAIKRIKNQTKTAFIDFELLHTELSRRIIHMEDNKEQEDIFSDHDIHQVLKNSGYPPLKFKDTNKDSEWFNVNLEVALKAIESYKKGLMIIPNENNLINKNINNNFHIKLRKEQLENIEKTINIFRKHDTMLWDCKMRYGKTVTAYELIKRMDLRKVIVITHRPAVEDSWDQDHKKIFNGINHQFIDKTNETNNSKINDLNNNKLLWDLSNANKKFVYFASMQDLRGSKYVGGNFDKNEFVFQLEWDLIIIDEAHEGVKTDLGDKVITALKKPNTKTLSLTGTAYSILEEYNENVFTWTYLDEQKAKKEWEINYPNEKNPYADLPTMNILTFDLGNEIKDSYKYVTESSSFNFREFFRTWTGDIDYDFYSISQLEQKGKFVHEEDVKSFLNLISKQDDESNYPFATKDSINQFKHTFWIVPGVKEANALCTLLKKHHFFKNYKIVNVAGEGDKEEPRDFALNKVREAIKENDKTITVSCGRLTTGITVKEWTAVMMLSGSSTTSINSYMQTIFRVQSPAIIEGKRKENCYVFDFAPDRALQVIANVHQLSSKSKFNENKQKEELSEFLNFCPVISFEGTHMQKYDVTDLMRQIKKISVDRAINSGFDDDSIYHSDAGIYKTDIDLEILRKLTDVVYPKKKSNKNKLIEIANNGLTQEEKIRIVSIERKPKKKLTDEEKILLDKKKKAKQEQQKLFDLLRAVSIRLPLLFYGAEADITEIIKLKDFVEIVDDESWEEFLPKNLSKNLFMSISKYYDEDVLVGAGLRIRKLAKAADEFPPTIRTKKIIEILSKFKNPDKETVLTPWKVVNLHMGETLGGYSFFDWNLQKENDEPIFIDKDEITKETILNPKAKILELNSKSGLYPLYVAYSMYKTLLKNNKEDLENSKILWNKILENNIFVLCKTKMARSITIRTLAGYSDSKVNAIYLTKLINERMKDLKRLSNKLTNLNTWKKEGEKMIFDAVIGNPPYQKGNQQIYVDFYLLARLLGEHVSMIFPSSWQEPKTANGLSKLNNENVKRDKQIMFIDNRQNVFQGIAGAEWVNILLWKRNFDNGLGGGKEFLQTESILLIRNFYEIKMI